MLELNRGETIRGKWKKIVTLGEVRHRDKIGEYVLKNEVFYLERVNLREEECAPKLVMGNMLAKSHRGSKTNGLYCGMGGTKRFVKRAGGTRNRVTLDLVIDKSYST